MSGRLIWSTLESEADVRLQYVDDSDLVSVIGETDPDVVIVESALNAHPVEAGGGRDLGFRYGLAVVLVLIGVLKFTPGEPAGIQPVVAKRHLISWMYGLLSLQGCSNVIGATEIAIAALMALRPLYRRYRVWVFWERS